MNKYGKLLEKKGRYVLQFERVYAHKPERVFRSITEPEYFTKWYPFATGKMELKVGGKIDFDDGEGTTYEGVITAFEPPLVFAFREVDDLLHMELQTSPDGCRMTFEHTFDDKSWAAATAAGWHRCLDALGNIVNDQVPEWPDNSTELREFYQRHLSV
jgi:uncharacterized protein YndB with AHSA1/START domain